MNPTISASIRLVDDFLLYLGGAVLLFVIFVWIYIHITPYRELKLIRQGNTAAACSLTGAMLGFVIPLASAIAHSVGFLDMVFWGAIALVVQLLAFWGARAVMPDLARDIPAGQVATGVFVGAVALAIGILNAAAMTY